MTRVWTFARMAAATAALSCCAATGWSEEAKPAPSSQSLSTAQTPPVAAAALRKKADSLLNGPGTGAHARGVALLRKAAAAGDVTAQTRLGKILLDGYYVPADPVAGRALLQKSVHAGDHDAARILGSQLISGWSLPRETDAGIVLMQKAVAAGDNRAMVELGNYYLGSWAMPRDKAKALALFEKAAKAGNGAGLESYGTDLMWSRADPAAAKAYLLRAVKLGQPSAWATLAEGEMYGYFGTPSNADFDHYAAQARAGHVQRIAVIEAARQMWGVGIPASGPKTLALLEQAATAGNRTAAIYLIALCRDGNNYNIDRSIPDATKFLTAYKTQLGAETYAQLNMTIEAAQARSVADYESLTKVFESHRSWHTDWFGKQLVAANKNLAIYIIQSKLHAEGAFGHAPTGLASRPTLVAMTEACRDFLNTGLCQTGVIVPNVMAPMMIRPVETATD